MKLLKALMLIGIVAICLPSCFLFKGGGHERCPAYGTNIDQGNSQLEDMAIEAEVREFNQL